MSRFHADALAPIRQSLEGRYEQSLDTFLELLQQLQALAAQDTCLPPEYLDQLTAQVLPPADGSFVPEFLDMATAFQGMRYTPPTAWLQCLDAAVLECSTDHAHLGTPSPVSPVQGLTLMALLADDALRSLQGHPTTSCCMMATPLVLEARATALHGGLTTYHPGGGTHADTTGHAAELNALLDKYYTAVQAHWCAQRSAGLLGAGGWWTSPHSLLSLLMARAMGPFYTRLGLVAQHVTASLDVLEACLVFTQEHLPSLLLAGRADVLQELEACMCTAMQHVHTHLGQVLRQRVASPAQLSSDDGSAPKAGSQEPPADGQGSAEWVVCVRAIALCQAVADVGLAQCTPREGVWSAVLLQQLLRVMGVTEQVAEGLVDGRPWDVAHMQLVDAWTCRLSDPEVLVTATDLMSRQPHCWEPDSPALRTPAKLLTLLSGPQLVAFTHTHLITTLRAVGRVTQLALPRAAAVQDQLADTPVNPSAMYLHDLMHRPLDAEAGVKDVMPDAYQEPGTGQHDLAGRIGARAAALLVGMSAQEQSAVLSWLKQPEGSTGNSTPQATLYLP